MEPDGELAKILDRSASYGQLLVPVVFGWSVLIIVFCFIQPWQVTALSSLLLALVIVSPWRRVKVDISAHFSNGDIEKRTRSFRRMDEARLIEAAYTPGTRIIWDVDQGAFESFYVYATVEAVNVRNWPKRKPREFRRLFGSSR